MIALICKSYRARVNGEDVVLEIDEAQPTDFVPRLLTKADVATRLAISERKLETLVASGRLPAVRIDSCIRFREADVLRLLTEHQQPTPRPIVSTLL